MRADPLQEPPNLFPALQGANSSSQPATPCATAFIPHHSWSEEIANMAFVLVSTAPLQRQTGQLSICTFPDKNRLFIGSLLRFSLNHFPYPFAFSAVFGRAGCVTSSWIYNNYHRSKALSSPTIHEFTDGDICPTFTPQKKSSPAALAWFPGVSHKVSTIACLSQPASVWLGRFWGEAGGHVPARGGMLPYKEPDQAHLPCRKQLQPI